MSRGEAASTYSSSKDPGPSAAGPDLPTPGTPDPQDPKEAFSPATPPWVDRWTDRLLYVLCILMHVVLLAFFAALVGLRARSKGAAFALDKFIPANLTFEEFELFNKLSLVPNVVIKVYLVPLLYLTQLLALKRDLHLKQTLTAMHDKSQAWLSLGASGVTIVKYRDLFSRKSRGTTLRQELAALGTVFSVFVYLAGSLVLGIIAPDLISTFTRSANDTSFEPLLAALPNIGQNVSLLQDAYPVVSLLSLLINDGNVNINGLYYNAIYNIPQFISDTPAPTNATAFEVSCQSIAGAFQAGDLNVLNATIPIHVHDALEDIDITPLPRSLNIRSAVWRQPTTDAPPPVLLVASTLLFEDVNGSLGDSVLSLNMTLSPEKCISTPNCTAVTDVQLMACTVSYQQAVEQLQIDTINWPYIVPNATDINANAFDILFSTPTLNWTDWGQPESTEDPILSNIGSFASLSPPSHAVQLFKLPESNQTASYTFSLLEESIMEAAGYYVDDDGSLIVDIENVLAAALATVFARAALNRDSVTAGEDESFGAISTSFSLEIKRWQPWLGTAVAATMLVLAAALTRLPARHGTEAHVSGLGVLELTWLLGRDTTGIAERAATLAVPTGANLRRHGRGIDVEFVEN
ncbi:hypothetical protein PsYK624_083020 [Phanerochaete sordida]|uniref:Uncharacterized protein n=1 Tax=Phanerochaete sordida TaxID=48140 RepID=A0A9P3GE94_9APHY|nr:hypothetical protein PsYK624_083020 [Phanerochaete sordida]